MEKSANGGMVSKWKTAAQRIVTLVVALAVVMCGCSVQNFAYAVEVDGTENARSDNAVPTDPHDPAFLQYAEDELYSGAIDALDGTDYLVEDIQAIYISQEYLEEVAYNSQANVYFGYTLAELDAAFAGTRYVFTLGDDGQTAVAEFETYDDTFDRVVRNVATGGGVILACATISLVSAPAAPAVAAVFAFAANSGTVAGISSGAIAGAMAGIMVGVQTGNTEEALKAAALAGSDGFKWGAITGAALESAAGFSFLAQARTAELLIPPTDALAIQRASKYPLGVIRQFRSIEEYQVYKSAGLVARQVNGRTALVREIDLDSVVDEMGRTNRERIVARLAPIDPASGKPYELHHIGQKSDSALAILTQAEHDTPGLHPNRNASEVEHGSAWATARNNFWRDYVTLFG